MPRCGFTDEDVRQASAVQDQIERRYKNTGEYADQFTYTGPPPSIAESHARFRRVAGLPPEEPGETESEAPQGSGGSAEEGTGK